MKLSLHPDAERDLAEAAAYCERAGSALVAVRFVAEFRRVANLLMAFPAMGSPRSRGRRGFAMSVFPYTVIYRPGADEILVLVVKHDSRRPGFGGDRS